MLGKIRNKIDERGFGFIKGSDNNDYYFHCTFLDNLNWNDIKIGDVVAFLPQINDHKQATHVTVATKNMKGKIKRIIDERGFGFITGSDNNDYYFHCTFLDNLNWNDIKVDDEVCFFPQTENGKSQALYIAEYIAEPPRISNVTVYPGMQRMVKTSHFNDEEQKILSTLAKTFYVTNGGEIIKLGATSEYRYCFIKPTDIFGTQFNLNREIIVIFSRYERFEPRTFDAVAAVYNKQPLRLDKICSVVVSKDVNAVNEIKRILKSDKEMQVIIPFSYNELLEGDKTNFITDRFREFFFERDLFAFWAPLKKDIYFFGRRKYVHDLINRHKSGENSGVFGLRRSGKTSVLEAVIRAAEIENITCIFIDCQELYHFRWNKALFFVMSKIASKIALAKEIAENLYDEEHATFSFSNDLQECLSNTEQIILMFDEIEQITPKLSLNNFWKDQDDFIKFWHAIRSNVNQLSERFTFILAGTNPSAVEMISINKHDNPLFNQLKADSYLPPFSVEDTNDMVNKLGGYMGLSFEDIVCANLTKDFGGHPYLIRHFCSAINNYVKENGIKKPINITNALYTKVMPKFIEKDADTYCKFILDVLVNYYPEENKFLEKLALGNVSDKEYNNIDPQLLTHLMGYNIVENNHGVLGYRIEVLKNYLLRRYSYKKQNMTLEEKRTEISERRNRLEPSLRKMVKIQLKSKFGEDEAKKRVLKSMKPEDKSKYVSLPYNDLFDPSKCKTYFMQLGILIDSEWDDCFKNILSQPKPVIRSYFTIINNLRADAHAKDITDDEMDSFRGAISILEKEVNNYFS